MTVPAVILLDDRRGEQQRRKTDEVDRLFDLSLDMLGTGTAEGYFSRLNPAWERTLGWTTQELMSEPYIAFVHPDDVGATLVCITQAVNAG